MDAILFDFDGVVIDSEPLHFAGFRDVLAAHGVTLTEAAYYSRYLGFDDHDCFVAVMDDLHKPLSDDDLHRWIAEKTALVQQWFASGVAALPGALELIDAAVAADVPIAICSGALHDEIVLALEGLGRREAFAVIVAAEDVRHGKPDPEGYERARRLLGEHVGRDLPAGQCVVVEDSPAGISAGVAAGAAVLGVATSYEAHHLAEADWVVGRLTEITLADLQRRLAER